MFAFFPFRDLNRPRRFPVMNWAIMGVCILVQVYIMFLDVPSVEILFKMYGFVPFFFTEAFDIMLSEKPSMILSPFTYMFLHGSLFHLIANMWALWIYGDNVEDWMGHGWFLFFYVFCGLAAVATHYVTHSGEIQPVVGASGALAGVMAAYLRLFPTAKIQCFFWFIFIVQIVEVPALFVIVVWFISQLMSVYSSLLGVDVGNVAWYAHIGGFLAGAWLSARWFPHHRLWVSRW